MIVQNDRALIVKRAAEPLKGHWSIPGGAVELGETLREAAEREALEETGLVVTAEEVVEVFDSIYRDPEGKTKYHYVLVDFACRPTGGQLQAGSDAAEVRWVTVEELPEYKVAEMAQRVVAKALASRTAAAG